MASTKTNRILILDDEPLICNGLVSFFEDEGYFALGVCSAQEALEKVKGDDIDLAIVDANLADTHGEDWIASASNVSPSLKFLIYTGQLDYQLSARLLKLGLTEQNIVKKPLLDFSEWTNLIKHHLDS